MKKEIAWIMAGVLCLSLCACRAEKQPELIRAEQEDSVVLDVVTCYGMDDGNAKNYDRAVAMYEEKTGNHVANQMAISNDDWKTGVLTDFTTGSEPDVLFYFSNAGATPFIRAGKVVSIEEIREVYPEYAANIEQTKLTESDDGKHYSVPAVGYWESLFVNKTVLDACGVEIPGSDYTWEQFLLDCERIKQAGYTPIACSLFEIPHYWFEYTVMNHGCPENHQEIPALDPQGHLVDNDVLHKWVAALEDIKLLYQSGYFSDNTLTAKDAETVVTFARGEAAFLLDGSWKIGYLSENYPENIEDYEVCFVPCMGQRQAADTIGGISMGYFISRKAWEDPEKQKAAVEFVSHMSSEEVVRMFVTTESAALPQLQRQTELNPLQQSAAQMRPLVTSVSEAVQDRLSHGVVAELFDQIPKVVTDQISAAEAIESALKMRSGHEGGRHVSGYID